MPNTKQDLTDARAAATAARATLRAARAAYRADPTPAAVTAVTDAIIALADALDATLTALRAARAASGPRPTSPPDNLSDAVAELCAIACVERDVLCAAMREDRAGEAEHKKVGGWRYTKTDELIGTFRPRYGPCAFDKAFRRAKTLASAHVLGKMEDLDRAHRVFIGGARTASYSSRHELPSMNDHGNAVTALVLLFGLSKP